MAASNGYPCVSVLMPTYKQASFIHRALESLFAQTFTEWELVIVDDGSPDETAQAVAPYLADSRIRYHRHDKNLGVGAALTTATGLARGKYIAYLPSDDLYYPRHLELLTRILDASEAVYIAYGGLRWNYNAFGATLRGDEWAGKETDALQNPPPPQKGAVLNNGNLLAMVQVMHRRDHEPDARWQPRSEIVTDRLEPNFWRALLDACGAQFQYAREITCEWVAHRYQHTRLIADGHNGGVSQYRQYYEISSDEPLNWQPSYGPRVDERERFAPFRTRRSLPSQDGLKILIVGELGFNPERIAAFEDYGHKLYGLWMPEAETWDRTGPLPFGNVDDIPYDRNWVEAVKAARPDVIYAMLNWHAIPVIYEVFKSNPGIPFVFHFKEGPFICQEKGTWPALIDIMRHSQGQIHINQESYEWMQFATANMLNPDTTLILDGDLPSGRWFTEDWSPKLSAQDGEIHTVMAGRPIGMYPAELAANKIHLHYYGDHFHQMTPNFTHEGVESGYMHPHPTVDPQNWVRELSQYDAAWFHIFESCNGGDLRRAIWDDLNMPARLGTYCAAGLPWILKDNRHSRVGLQSVALQHDVGIFFKDLADLAEQLRDRQRLAQLTENMRRARKQFAFDTHVESLTAFFRRAIDRVK